MNDPARANLELGDIEQPRSKSTKFRDPVSDPTAAARSSVGIKRTTALTLLALVVSAFAVNELVDGTLRKEIHDKQLALPNSLLESVRSKDSNRLSQYRWVRKNEGVVSIPIGRAKRLVIKDYAETQGSASLPSSSGAP